jgi:hypothetical protein
MPGAASRGAVLRLLRTTAGSVSAAGSAAAKEEEGDFVASDLSIVYDRLTDSGIAFETHAFAGIEFPPSPVWNLTIEGRYSWADTDVSGRWRR